MRVLHINGGTLHSGAGRGVLYLHRALRELGVQSQLICRDPAAEGEGILSLSRTPWQAFTARLRSRAEALPLRLYPRRTRGLFSLGIASLDWPACEVYRAADIVHLHWAHQGVLSIAGLARIDKPCIWTLRDMWSFTGGCHYSMDCRRYETACGACPALGSRSERDLSRWVFRRKQRHYSSDISVVGISSWISDCARSSPLLRGNDVRTILNCVDTDRFRPVDKLAARRQLGLPADRPILLHGALNLASAYKGGNLLEEAKTQLAPEEAFICTFGTAPGGAGIRQSRAFGHVKDDELLRTIYCAADVLVFPSVQEAFGKVAAESLACGTPVVAFGATGPRDIVVHKRTGYLAAPFDPADLISGVRWLLADRERLARVGQQAAADARERFSPTAAARKYRELYELTLGVS